jgi:hypothetical protein
MEQRVGFESGGQADKPKHPYVALQRINDKMNDSEKAGINMWNSMVNWIRSKGEMEEK